LNPNKGLSSAEVA